MRRIRSCLGLVLTATSAVLAGCYVPTPTTHAVLQVPAVGSYVLDGVVVEPTDLARVLAARQAQAPLLLLEIHASAQASSTSINTAVEAAKKAHLRIAFAGGPPTH